MSQKIAENTPKIIKNWVGATKGLMGSPEGSYNVFR